MKIVIEQNNDGHGEEEVRTLSKLRVRLSA